MYFVSANVITNWVHNDPANSYYGLITRLGACCFEEKGRWVSRVEEGILGREILICGEGKWGIAARPKGMPECFGEGRQCLFVDFSSAAHHVSFELPNRFKSMRVGDGEIVVGKRMVDGKET